ncbi:MAG TPA: nuclear transport factor 2 family protein [Polyangiaceae bacterium]|nr:nuclear transport factor 2 family protein [Polyangiaceae bacterium]
MPSSVETAVETYVRACCERDATVRASLFQQCLAEDVRMVTQGREVRGRAALVAMLERFFTDSRLLGIRLTSAIDARGTIFRYTAAADFVDGTSPETFDAGEVDSSGLISLILTFPGPLPPSANANGRS